MSARGDRARLALRALGRMALGLGRWAAVSLGMALVVLATLVSPLLVGAGIEALFPQLSDLLLVVIVPLTYVVPVAGVVYGWRRLRAFREDVPEVDASLAVLRALRDDPAWVGEARGGELSVAEEGAGRGGLSVSAAAGGGDLEVSSPHAAAREQVDVAEMARTPRREVELERGFFSILAKYTRNTMLFLGSFAIPAMSIGWISGAGVMSTGVLILGFMLMFAALMIGALYIGVADMDDETLRGRHQGAVAFGAMFTLVGAIPALQHLPAWRVIPALAVAPVWGWLLWRAYVWRSGRAAPAPSSDPPTVAEDTQDEVGEEVALDLAEDEVGAHEVEPARHARSE